MEDLRFGRNYPWRKAAIDGTIHLAQLLGEKSGPSGGGGILVMEGEETNPVKNVK